MGVYSFAMLLLASFTACSSMAATINWTNVAGGNWGTTSNWSPNQVPGAADDAYITNNGTYSVTNNGTATAGSLTLGGSSGVQTLKLSGGTFTLNGPCTGNAQSSLSVSGGTLAGSGALTLNGTFTWTSGTLNDSVQFTSGTVGTGSTKILNAELLNGGTLTWNDNIYAGPGSVITNPVGSTITVASGVGTFNNGGTRIIANNGTFTLSGPGISAFSDTFNNGGVVNVNGTLNLSGGGAETGSFSVPSSATLELSSGTWGFQSSSSLSGAGNFMLAGGAIANLAGTFAITGAYTFSGGTANFSGSGYSLSGNIPISGSTINLNGSGTFAPGALNVSAGVLAGSSPPNPIVVGTTFTWTGGTLNDSVQFTSGTVGTGSTKILNAELLNGGTLAWNDTMYTGGSAGSLITNPVGSTITVASGVGTFNNGGTRIIANNGTFTLSGPGISAFSDTFNNGGLVNVNGTLNLSGGGAETGSFSVPSSATLELSSGTWGFQSSSSLSGAGNFMLAGGAIANLAGTFAITGAYTFSGGTANFSGSGYSLSGNILISGSTINLNGSGTFAPGALNVSAGVLAGSSPPNPIVVGTTFTWTGGTLNDSVQFTSGTVGTGSTKILNAELLNGGTLAWNDTMYTGGSAGSLITNPVGSTITVASGVGTFSQGGTRIIANNGTFTLSGPGISAFSDTFNNGGLVNVNGTLNLSGGGAETGSFSVPSSATLELSSGTWGFQSSSSLSGAGNFMLAGGAIANLAGTFAITGAYTFSGGTANFSGSGYSLSGNIPISGSTINLNGSGTFAPGALNVSAGVLAGSSPPNPIVVGTTFTWTGGTLNDAVEFTSGTVGTGNSKTLNAELLNGGTLAWNDNIYTGPGSVITNPVGSTITVAPGVGTFNNGGTRMIANSGTFTLSGPGTSSFNDTFTNTGTININSGVLNLVGIHSLTGGTLNFGINALNNYGSNILAGASALAGSLKATFNGSYLPAVGNTYNIMTYGSSSGRFTTTNLSPLAVWQVNQASTALSITVLKLVPQLAWSRPADIVYGTALGGAQLNATATWNGSSVSGTFAYNPPLATVLSSGSNQTLSVTFTPADPSTYISVSTNVQINVLKAPLAILASSQTKTYGQNLVFAGTEFISSGLVNGDTVLSVSLASDGASPTAPVSGSPYDITVTNAVGDPGLTNYVISYTNGTLTVNPAPLIISANNRSKTYGQNVTFVGTEFTPSGLQNSETVGLVTLTSSGAVSTAPVSGSPYDIFPSAASGGTFDPANYSLTYLKGILTVNPAALTITASDRSKTYGQTVAFAGTEFTTAGLENSETVGSVTLTSTGAVSNAPVSGSPYVIVPSAASGGTFDPANYSFVYSNGILTINPAALMITASDRSKTYGQNVTFAGTEFTSSGLQNLETVGLVSLVSTGAVSNAPISDSPYAIMASAASGGTFDPANYSLVYSNGILTINPAALMITASDRSKTYGQNAAFAGTEFTPSGLQNLETVGLVSLVSTGAVSNAPVSDSPYAIVASAASGGTFDPANYSLVYSNGILTVGPAALTITADNTNKIVGQVITFTGKEFGASGLQNGETVDSVTLISDGAVAVATAGAYDIVPSEPAGGTFDQGNYTNSFVNGTLNVLTSPQLTVSLAGTNTVVTFPTIVGESYQLLSTTNLAIPGWTPVGTAVDGTGGSESMTNGISTPASFYRLQIQN
jgi:hypothetical protein